MIKKSIFSIILVLIILASIGCVNDIAKTSANVEGVFATYSIAFSDSDSTDRLRSSAELPYYKMDITPKSTMEVKGVSFDAKVKTGEQDFTIKLYIIRKENDGEKGNPVSEQSITVKDTFSTFTVNLNSPYPSVFAVENNPAEKDVLSIEFFKSGELNSDTPFSINNILLKE